MRVGLVICGDLGTVSGGFLYDRELVRALRNAGDTVEVIQLPWEGYGRSLARNFDSRARARLMAWQGDLLLQDELAHPSLVLLNRTLHRAGVPLVSIVHHLRLSEDLAGPARAGIRVVERAYLRGVDAFVFNGQSTRRSVEALRGAAAPCIVAAPGGDRLECGATDEEAAARALRAGALQVLFVGNIIPRKGLPDVLLALAGIERSAWHLTVVGSPLLDPAHWRKVQRLVRERRLESNVAFAGPVEDAELARLMRAHHVLAVPSAYEGFGIVYLEAMGFGLVPIGSTAGGASEVIEHDASGFLVAPGDTAALGRILSDLGRDRTRLASLAVAARRRHARFPGWSARMAEVGAWLHSVADRTAA
jgi:glycosyltransferase involved in cell wall biosynthesis